MDLSTLMPQQKEIVCTLDRPLFVSAGAGSGKTFTLTRRILWALSPESGPFIDHLDQVLAITFTKDAAADLRNRVRQALIGEGMEKEALAVDDAWISTIHGMCARILRAHALEMEIDPEFAVASEIEAAELATRAIDSVIAELRGERAVEDSSAEKTLDPAAFQELLSWYPLSPEAGPDGRAAGASIRSLVARLLDLSSSLPDGMAGIEFAGHAFDLSSLEDVYRPLLDVRGKGADIARAALDAIDRFRASERGMADLSELMLACQVPRKSKAFDQGMVDLLKAEIADAFANGVIAYGGAAVDELRALSLVVERRFRKLKREKGLLDNGDLLRCTYEALSKHPEIRAAYAGRFKMVMIDEFQDTDQMQVDIINYLTGEGGRALCTVGDAQQSIYRFRGAEVEVFRQQERSIVAQSKAEAGAAGAKRIELVRNFRSHSEVLRYVAQIFNDKNGGLMHGFLDLEADAGHTGAYAAKNISRSQAFLVVGGSVEDRTRAKAEAIAKRFAALAQAGQPAGDMVLLLGGMTRAGVYADAIRAAGLDCVIAGGSVFSSTVEAQTVRALVCTLANPADTAQGLMPLLSSPMFALGAEEFMALATRFDAKTGETFRRNIDRGLNTHEDAPGLENLPLVARAREILAHALQRVGAESFAGIARRVVNESGWLARLAGTGAEGRSHAANVLKALDAVAEAEAAVGNAPREIAAAMDAFLAGKEAPGALNVEGGDAVRIMTVHASKGLEFPVVAVADCFGIRTSLERLQTRRRGNRVETAAVPARFLDAHASDGAFIEGSKVETLFKKAVVGTPSSPAWLTSELTDDVCATGSAAEAFVSMREEDMQRSLEERARLLYVAMTRAEEAVILAMDAKIGSGKEHDIKLDDRYDLTPLVLERILPGGETALDLSRDTLVFDDARPGDFELIALSDFKLGTRDYVANTVLGADDGAKPAAPGPADPEPDSFTLAYPADVRARVAAAFPAPRDSYSYSSMAAALHEETDEHEVSFARVFADRASADLADDWSSEELPPEPVPGSTGEPSPAVAETTELLETAPAGAPTQPAASPTRDGDPTALGSAFHAAAQWLIETSAARVPAAKRDALARQWKVTPDQRTRLDTALDRWESSQVRAELCSWPLVRAEVPFFSLGLDDADVRKRFGTYAEGAIDALATDPNDSAHAFVIDYKTGGSALETPDELRKKHALQARVYADVLHKAGFEHATLKFVRVEQTDPRMPNEPQVVEYAL